MCIRFRRYVRNIARLTFNAVRNIAILKFGFSSCNSFKNGFSLNLPDRGWCHDQNSQSSRSFLSFRGENKAPRQAKKCLGFSGNLKIQMRMLSHSEGLGILILTKDAFWPHVDVCEGNRSFRTEVISY